MAVKARRTRLFQLVAGCFADDEANRTNAMESLPATVTISRNGPLFQQAESCYRSNLQRIVTTASSAGIPVVLTTVAEVSADAEPCLLLDRSPEAARVVPQRVDG